MAKATHNLQINSISYLDSNISNNPNLRAWDYTFKLLGMGVDKPYSQAIQLAPGESKVVFDSSAAISASSGSVFSISQPSSVASIYKLSYVSGTQPNFRVNRSIGVDLTSNINILINGPIAVLSTTSGTSFNTSSIVVGDVLRLDAGSGALTPNVGTFTVKSKTSNTITITSGSLIADSFILLDTTKLLVYSAGGAGSVQIGDNLELSGAFSPANYGSYEILDVTPQWILFAGDSVALEPSVTLASSGDIKIYNSVKRFLLIAAQQPTIIQCNESTDNSQVIEPLESNIPESAGMYLKMGSVYKLTIKNSSIFDSIVVVNSAE